MSMPVNIANHPMPPVAATQVVTSPKELNPVKSAMGTSASPVKHTMPDKSIQSSPALPAVHGQAGSSPLGHRHESTPVDSAVMPSPKPTSNTETVKGDSTLKLKPNVVLPTLATNADDKDAENLKSDIATPADQDKENALTGKITDLWSRQKGKPSRKPHFASALADCLPVFSTDRGGTGIGSHRRRSRSQSPHQPTPTAMPKSGPLHHGLLTLPKMG